ncbi:hypothetical protein MtrunA17_Chr4g0007661 [Medicago truncatula]|uniref:Uncharacterized protein n=1 Tax=Medicago truncatula TaxID=3880 RepID=A0A072UHP4_MEDTR|nr:uncharacterized protein At4g13200, chloroplastic [Medicago truncatula]KEH28936.1 hypothetical protein MTR_4g017880 [Medicago truncatula]RHN58928.1 hypothetical protein MtrunA17_Chr4g0007661 [Medicago truncatula]
MNTTTLSPSPSPTTFASPRFSKTFSNILVPSSSKPISIQLPSCNKRGFQTTGLRCNNTFFPGGPPSGDGDSSSKNVLDAFFLGKALAETLNERIESTLGELLSTVGRLQAEQQKQVQEFQEEVLDRAKKAKEKAAREATEAQPQGLVSKSTAYTEVVVDSSTSETTDPVTSVQSTDVSEIYIEPNEGEDPTLSS